MSRAKDQDKSTDVSLFPFLAVLLCTMGSLLVVLVAVTRMSRDKADELAAEKRSVAAAPAPQTEAWKSKRREVEQYSEFLEKIRVEAEKKLGDDQQRLSHIEEHIRRLQKQLESLQIAAAELASLKDEHSQDKKQAEKELARLQKLIDETRETIAQLREQEDDKPRSYAVVPYEGNSGTRRRPIYIECRRNKVILQPEGLELTPNDFLPPLGPGNPLASALRAAREYIAADSPVADTGKDTMPYPLILVRPEGIAAYYRVRDAIESWDADFGYELIDGDWDLEFPQPNAQLAEAEYRAIELARARERMLAAAAPRAYGVVRSARGGGFDVDEPYDGDDLSEGGYADYGPGNGGSSAVGPSSGDGEAGQKSGDTMLFGAADAAGKFGDDGKPGSDGKGNGKGSPGASPLAGVLGPDLQGPGGDEAGGEAGNEAGAGGDANKLAGGGVGTLGQKSGQAGQSSSQGPDGSPGSAGGKTPGGGQMTGSAGGSPSDGTSSMAAGSSGSMSMASSGPTSGGSPTPSSGSSAMSNPEGSPGTISFEQTFGQPGENAVGPRGKDWALGGVKRDAVPIRRSIQVVVRRDRIAILPERTISGVPATGGKEVPLPGATASALDDFVNALQDTMRDWGMAGQGLYWRPVLVLNVGPDGEQRANELTKLLHNSGLELRRAEATAQHDEGASSSATR